MALIKILAILSRLKEYSSDKMLFIMTSSLEGGEWGGVSQKLKIDDMMTRWWAT